MKKRSPLLTALFHPLNIATAVVSVFAGLVSAWWMFPIGILFWLIMVIIVSRDRALRFNHQMQQREPLAQRFQRYFDRIERSQLGIFNTLSSAPARTQRVLQPVQDAVSNLTAEAYALCQRMTSLENYRVVSQSQTDLTSDLAHIDDVIARTEDEMVRKEYEDSRQALQERIAKLDQVSNQLDRVEAQLMSLANDMDGMTTEIVRLQAAGPESAQAYVPNLEARLRKEAEELRAFEQQASQI